MKPMSIIITLVIVVALTACNGGDSSEQSEQKKADLSNEQQAELVAATLSSDKGGVEDDFAGVAKAASGDLDQQTQARNASLGYSVSVTVEFYDAEDNLQETYDPETTDQIDYESHIKGNITDGNGFFRELNIDNQSVFSVDAILSQYIWINGHHTNHSSYKRTQHLTQADVDYQLDSELKLTDVALDLKAEDTFPESGTVEGRLKGHYKREATTWQKNEQFEFQFTATFIGDNTAEVELADGTVFIVKLDSGEVEFEE